MITFRNFIPDAITLFCGRFRVFHTFQSAGIARVSSTFTEIDWDLLCKVKYGEVEGLPEKKRVFY